MTNTSTNIEFNWSQIAKVLFEANGIDSGLWQLAVKLRFAGLNMQLGEGPEIALDMAAAVPSAVTAFEGLVLFPSKQPGPMVFDAAVLLAPAAVPPPVQKSVRKKATAKKVPVKK